MLESGQPVFTPEAHQPLGEDGFCTLVFRFTFKPPPECSFQLWRLQTDWPLFVARAYVGPSVARNTLVVQKLIRGQAHTREIPLQCRKCGFS